MHRYKLEISRRGEGEAFKQEGTIYFRNKKEKELMFKGWCRKLSDIKTSKSFGLEWLEGKYEGKFYHLCFDTFQQAALDNQEVIDYWIDAYTK